MAGLKLGKEQKLEQLTLGLMKLISWAEIPTRGLKVVRRDHNFIIFFSRRM